MARATGTRFIAAVLFLVGGLIPILGWITLWPIGYKVWKSAKEKEQEAEQRQEYFKANVD